MSKCSACRQWFIIGDVKIIQHSSLFHRNCFDNNSDSGDTNCKNLNDVPMVETLQVAPAGDTWNCAVCTLINAENYLECELCGSSKDIIVQEQFDDTEEERCPPLQSKASIIESAQGPEEWHFSDLQPVAVPTMHDALIAHTEILTCVSCDIELTEANQYPFAGCSPHCKTCLARWFETQICNGNSLVLRCLCGEHSLSNYGYFRSLSDMLSTTARTIYNTAQRTRPSSIVPERTELQCPGCDEMVSFYPAQPVYRCYAPGCQAEGRGICVRHNLLFTRPLSDRGEVDMSATPRCARCLEAANGSVLVADALGEIQAAWCDRCFGCKGAVGEPEDFSSCMALKCSHCPQSFCGFCYGHAGTWQESHAHVRTCVRNPRENFYAESEQVWRELMRLRRIRLAEGIIAQRPALNPTECILIRSEYSKLL